MGVGFLPDAVHAPVRSDPQEKASVLAVQPLGLLEAPRKAAAAVVFRYGGKCGDLSCGHLLRFTRFLRTAAPPSVGSSSLAVASHQPPPLLYKHTPEPQRSVVPFQSWESDTQALLQASVLNTSSSHLRLCGEAALWGGRVRRFDSVSLSSCSV